MKRALLIVAGLLVLVLAGGGFAVSRIDPETLRSKVADMTREATGKPLYMAHVPKISFIPLGVTFGEVSWGMVDGKAAPTGISAAAKGGAVSVDFLSLLSGKIVAHEVRLDSPTVVVRPEAPTEGKDKAQDKEKAQSKDGASSKAQELPLELARLNITNGSLLLEQGKGESVRVEAFNASITNLKPGAEASIKLDLGIKMDNPALHGNVAMAGNVRQDKDRFIFRQSKLSLTPLGGVVPAAVGAIQLALDGSYVLSSGALDLSALRLSLNGLLVEAAGKGKATEGQFDGSLRLTAEPALLGKHVGLNLPAFPGSGKSTLEFKAAISPQTVRLENIKGSLDSTTLDGALTLGLGNVPSVEGRLQVGAVNLDPMLKQSAGSKDGKATASGKKAEKSVGSEGQKAAGTIYPRVDLDLRVTSLTANKLTLKDMHIKLKGAGGQTTRYTADPAQWTFATGGSQSAVVSIELPSMRCAVNMKIKDLAVGPLLQALNGSRPVDAVAFADYALSMNATSARTIKSSLSGKGLISAQNIVLNNVSVLPKGTPVKGGTPTHFSRFALPFTAQNGTITITGMTLTGEGLNAQGKGVVRLPQEDVNMAATVATLGLQIPVTVSGPFSNISYGVDPKWAKNILTQLPGTLLDGGKSAGGAVKDGGSKLGGAGEKVGGAIKGLFGR